MNHIIMKDRIAILAEVVRGKVTGPTPDHIDRVLDSQGL
jgi:hypothetical protein